MEWGWEGGGQKDNTAPWLGAARGITEHLTGTCGGISMETLGPSPCSRHCSAALCPESATDMT